MSILIRLCFSLLIVLLLSHYAMPADMYETLSPAPEPDSGDDSPFAYSPLLSPDIGAPETYPPSMELPYLSPEVGSPPAPPLDNPEGDFDLFPVPLPAPSSSDLIAADDAGEFSDFDEGSKSSGGAKDGSGKVGLTVGVIMGVCIVGLAGLVYKKRRDNTRRNRRYNGYHSASMDKL